MTVDELIENRLKVIEIRFIKSELDMTGDQMQRFQDVLAGIDRRFDIVMRRRGVVK
ncbi:hypothetical protein XccvBFoX7_gp64c [Xanthomonas phage FoX7]|uniref:Uncharacterized protein n=2 Tax=Carpasinavirus XcP1 TaxID=2182344 RepID=A0A858NQB9_9CAUD|nr:hypothetical protein XccvBFoX6_gp64c [Xanthomonas phage FoX6]QJB22221.1 hypothetical protein XccvBFoX7_gp64c [Xanthomonas phage FoX7]